MKVYKTIEKQLENYAHACKQCGNTTDFMVVFTDYPICGKCTRKNHKKALGGK